ncbi:LytR C-terminal domain-containing protein [Flexivirga sp. ID2601S]|uniref:LytR C-terminal domain-containing protein n=1 Tax=Flexivirga aerilata TaxID=1656889 RepID=A0A849AB17_9MICO|nr:LytR C-terminal domain-containing protein [Flexivirga aerilata]NNG38114.1 LytR C-terminal domain-containing protein [Flexivirga aerilata]
MSYVRDNGLARARKRRQRRSIAIVIVAAVLVTVGFVYAIAYMNRSKPVDPTAASCVLPTSQAPAQASFVLNVYNASTDTGRAKTSGAAMKSQGFNVGVISNDPYKLSLKGIGQIRFGPKGKSNAEEFVSKMLPGAELMQDGRTDDSVDLVLGNQAPTIPSQAASPVSLPPGC